MATATVEFNVNIKQIFEYLKQNISNPRSQAVTDIDQILENNKRIDNKYILENMNDKIEAHMFMMFMEYALNCTKDKKKIDNLSNDIEYNKVKECYNKMYIKMTETNKDFNQVYSYLHSVLEKPSGLVNSSGKANVSKKVLKAGLHSREIGDFDFNSPPSFGDPRGAPSSAPRGASSFARGFASSSATRFAPSSATGFASGFAPRSAPGFAPRGASSSATLGSTLGSTSRTTGFGTTGFAAPSFAPGFAAPRDTTLGSTSSAPVYNKDQYGKDMPLGWTYEQNEKHENTYKFKYGSEKEIIQDISPNGDNINIIPGENKEFFITNKRGKRGDYRIIPKERQIKTNGQTKGHTTMMMGQQPIAQSMMGQTISGHTMGHSMMDQPMMGQPMMGQPMMGQPMMGQPMMGQPMAGQPMMGQSMMGQPMADQSMVNPKLKKGKNPQGFQLNLQGVQPNRQFFQPNRQFFQQNPHFSQPKLQGFQTQQPGLPQQSGFPQQQQMSIPTQYTPQQLQTFVGKKIKYSNGKVGGAIISYYPNGTFILDTLNQQTGENKTVHINSFPKIWTLA